MRSIYQYLRVSTNRQTFEFQKDVLDLYCRTKGLIVKDTVKEIASGWKEYNQPKLTELISSIDNRRKHYSDQVNILCLRPDRFSRNVNYAERMLNDLHQREGLVIFVDRYGIRSSLRDKELLLEHIKHSQYHSDMKSIDTRLRKLIKTESGSEYPFEIDFGPDKIRNRPA